MDKSTAVRLQKDFDRDNVICPKCCATIPKWKLGWPVAKDKALTQPPEPRITEPETQGEAVLCICNSLGISGAYPNCPTHSKKAARVPQADPKPQGEASDSDLKQFGYAPGVHCSKCHRCDSMYHGLDKLAICCRTCAIEALEANNAPD